VKKAFLTATIGAAAAAVLAMPATGLGAGSAAERA